MNKCIDTEPLIAALQSLMNRGELIIGIDEVKRTIENMLEASIPGRTRVRCTFKECQHIRDVDEEGYGICSKDEITLDDFVESIDCGCPDGEWNDKDIEEYDPCEECRILGDDYTFDEEDACVKCPYNQFRGDDD